jgi:hypothetical protein
MIVTLESPQFCSEIQQDLILKRFSAEQWISTFVPVQKWRAQISYTLSSKGYRGSLHLTCSRKTHVLPALSRRHIARWTQVSGPVKFALYKKCDFRQFSSEDRKSVWDQDWESAFILNWGVMSGLSSLGRGEPLVLNVLLVSAVVLIRGFGPRFESDIDRDTLLFKRKHFSSVSNRCVTGNQQFILFFFYDPDPSCPKM